MLKLTQTYLSRPITKQSLYISLATWWVVMATAITGWYSSHFSKLITATHESLFNSGTLYQLFTTSFAHEDFTHLASNGLFFVIFATLLSNYFGFFIFPLLSFLVGGLINALTLASYPEHSSLIGASGIVYFMAAFWMTSFFLIHKEKTVINRLMTVTGVSLILLFPQEYQAHVSYAAHFIGFLFGIASSIVYYLIQKKVIQNAEVWTTINDPIHNHENETIFDEFGNLVAFNTQDTLQSSKYLIYNIPQKPIPEPIDQCKSCIND